MTAIALDKPFELDRNEQQLWTGAPRRGLVLRASDAYVIPFSILWAGFTVFWEAGALRAPNQGFFVLWGIPFLLIGLYITIGRFFADAWQRGQTAYALTSDRVIIRTGGSLKSLSLRGLSEVTLTERADGTGTIAFGPNGFPMSMYEGIPGPGVPKTPSFELIPDARHVYEQIRQAQQSSSGVR